MATNVTVLMLWNSEGLVASGAILASVGRWTIRLRRADAAPFDCLAGHSRFFEAPSDERWRQPVLGLLAEATPGDNPALRV